MHILVSEPHLRELPRNVILNEHIARLYQLAQNLETLGFLEVDSNRALVAVRREEVRRLGREVRRSGGRVWA